MVLKVFTTDLPLLSKEVYLESMPDSPRKLTSSPKPTAQPRKNLTDGAPSHNTNVNTSGQARQSATPSSTSQKTIDSTAATVDSSSRRSSISNASYSFSEISNISVKSLDLSSLRQSAPQGIRAPSPSVVTGSNASSRRTSFCTEFCISEASWSRLSPTGSIRSLHSSGSSSAGGNTTKTPQNGTQACRDEKIPKPQL